MCKQPIRLKNEHVVKCGRCIECLQVRSREWANRLEIESETAKTGVFLTLTYSDDNAIWVDTDHGTVTTLDKSDLQKFIKLLRYYQKQAKNQDQVRYFACGEYGGKTKRAHYHAIVFNLDRSVIKKVDKIWDKGFTVVGDVTSKSIRYVSNYMLLKDTDIDNKIQQKPFTLMSKKPMIGHRYMDNAKNIVHHAILGEDEMRRPTKGNKPYLPNTFLKNMVGISTLQDIKRKRIENYQKKLEEDIEQASKIDPLDPIGQYNKSKEEKIRQKENRYSNYKLKNQL